jgi:hypothetical protein
MIEVFGTVAATIATVAATIALARRELRCPDCGHGIGKFLFWDDLSSFSGI